MAIDRSCLLDQSFPGKSHPCLHVLFAKIKHQPQMTLDPLSQCGHRPEECLAWRGGCSVKGNHHCESKPLTKLVKVTEDVLELFDYMCGEAWAGALGEAGALWDAGIIEIQALHPGGHQSPHRSACAPLPSLMIPKVMFWVRWAGPSRIQSRGYRDPCEQQYNSRTAEAEGKDGGHVGCRPGWEL